jgi:hypothetical protein
VAARSEIAEGLLQRRERLRGREEFNPQAVVQLDATEDDGTAKLSELGDAMPGEDRSEWLLLADGDESQRCGVASVNEEPASMLRGPGSRLDLLLSKHEESGPGLLEGDCFHWNLQRKEGDTRTPT